MFNIKIDWLPFIASVIIPFIISVYFFFSYRRQAKDIRRLEKKEWQTMHELDERDKLVKSNKFFARFSLFFFVAIFLFSLVMAARSFKFF
jgi:hypothetical protein